MTDTNFSLLAAPLKSVYKAVMQHVVRLHAEESAIRSTNSSDLVDLILNETLDRLRGGDISDVWWKKILATIQHKYVAPDFLKVAAVQEWLDQEKVARDFKFLATSIVMGNSSNCKDHRDRLATEYSNFTGEHVSCANVPIDIVTAILVAGFCASISRDQQPIAGMLQQLSRDLNQRLDNLEERQNTVFTELSPAVKEFLTKIVEDELSGILSLRAFGQVEAQRKIQRLYDRVSQGDLSAIDESSKHKVYQWTARLCATRKDSLPLAKQIRYLLASEYSNPDLSIIDALICETEGNVNDALRKLRNAEDQESRSVWFGILTRVKGEEKALKWFKESNIDYDQNFFSSAGWINWAIAATKCGEWENTAQALLAFHMKWEEMPALSIVEGSVNAALLLPDDYKLLVLEDLPLYDGITPISNPTAEAYHSRALECFEFAKNKLKGRANNGWLQFLADWIYWLQLMDPNTGRRDAARSRLQLEMTDGAKALALAPFAYYFSIDYDPKPLKAYLEQCREFGGFDKQSRLAEFFVSVQFLERSKLTEYLIQNEDDLKPLVPGEFWSAHFVQSIIDEEKPSEEARSIIEMNRDSLDIVHIKRLEMMVDAYEGNGIREKLEDLYQDSGNLVDLHNLISFLKQTDDREALRPLCLEMYRRVPSERNAIDVVASLSGRSIDHGTIISFLDEHKDLLDHSEQLQGAKFWAYFHAGRYAEAKAVIEKTPTPENLLNGLNTAIAAGDWENIGGLLNEAWGLRETYGAQDLIWLANLAGQDSQTKEIALEFLKLAATKAPNDATVLTAVYSLHFQFDSEQEADPSWLSQAMNLSTEEKGPIWNVSLLEFANDWLPKRRNQMIEIEQRWAQGDLPIHYVADVSNNSLSRMLIDLPTKNANMPDSRRKSALPIASADRTDVRVDGDWTVGVDVTSIMVLQHLGILEHALDAFRHIKFSPSIFEVLFQERTEARFHQPSRIAAAKLILELHGRNKIEILEPINKAPSSLVQETGIETADALQWAKDSEGIVVCIRPIYRVNSLMEIEADIGQFEDASISLTSFVNWLNDTGKIESDAYERLCAVLQNSKDTQDQSIPVEFAQKAICFDRLALQNLIDAGSLQMIVSALGVIRIHRDVFQEMRALTDEEDSGDAIIATIEKIRSKLRSRIEAGRASFLPRSDAHFTNNTDRLLRWEATASLLYGGAEWNAVFIDDRFINCYSNLLGPDEQIKPLLSVTNFIKHLVTVGQMTEAEYYRTRHKLRAGGFVFVPLETEEICHWLKAAQVNDGKIVESIELRVLRQTVARSESLVPTDRHQIAALVSNINFACTEAIAELWEDANLESQIVTAQSNWIWLNLMTTVVSHYKEFDYKEYERLVKEVISLRIGGLLVQFPSRSQERQEKFAQWAEQTILKRMRPANADTIHAALANLRDAISSLKIDQAAYGSLFLKQLPERARVMAIRDDPEFAERCGYRSAHVFSIGLERKVLAQILFEAAAKVFRDESATTVSDESGREISVTYNQEDGIRLNWLDGTGAEQEVNVVELGLLSPNGEVRRETFKGIAARLGPTFDAFDRVQKTIVSERPDPATLSMIFDANSNGVAAVQADISDKILNGQAMNHNDFVPDSIDYFENFAGPLPTNQAIKSYIREVLAPYRQTLIARNLEEGLHICCLGALHDDLSPGQWLTHVDDDTLWSALKAINSSCNPFSQLGALDVSLYRQHDRRYREFAASAVEQLLDDNFGFDNKMDVYRLLQIVGNFVLNRIHLIEDGATQLGYWKRLSGWMQTGYIVELMLELPNSFSLDPLEKWSHANMELAGAYANLIDGKAEPMIFASQILKGGLRYEIVGRLDVLKRRHEHNGIDVPASDKIAILLEDIERKGHLPALWFPGPLEGDWYPTDAPPHNVELEVESAVEAESRDVMPFLVVLSQLYSLNDRQLVIAKSTIERSCEETQNIAVEDVLQNLEHASIIAATNRSTSLSAKVGDKVLQIAPLVSETEVERIPRILLQAAAAFQDERDWFVWLERNLNEVANRLASHPSPTLRRFSDHLETIEIILPAKHWFHAQARLCALMGVA